MPNLNEIAQQFEDNYSNRDLTLRLLSLLPESEIKDELEAFRLLKELEILERLPEYSRN